MRSYANVLLRLCLSSTSTLDPPLPPLPLTSPRPRPRSRSHSLPPPPSPPPPPRLIHIHAVVIVCRLPAGGHYYTSCARSRYREATTLATLLLACPAPASHPLRFPLASSISSPSPSSILPSRSPPLFRRCCLWLPAARRRNTNPRFTTVSSNNSRTYHVAPAGVLYLLPALARVCK